MIQKVQVQKFEVMLERAKLDGRDETEIKAIEVQLNKWKKALDAATMKRNWKKAVEREEMKNGR